MGQAWGFGSALLTETTKWTSPLTSPSIHSWHWWGKMYRGCTPKEGALSAIYSCTSPLYHSNPPGIMLFKSLFYCSWLVMFHCSLAWQHRLSSVCTSASEFLLWSTTVIHLPGHDVTKNSFILVFLFSNKILSSWTLLTKFPSQIFTTIPSVSSSLHKLLLKLFLVKPPAHLQPSTISFFFRSLKVRGQALTYPTCILGLLWWTA